MKANRFGRLTWWDFTRYRSLKRSRRFSVTPFFAGPGGRLLLREEGSWRHLNGFWFKWRGYGFWFVFRRPSRGDF